MASLLLSLLVVISAMATFFSVSATVVMYNVTFVSCIPGSTCPQGNPAYYNRTFALNGNLSPNVTLMVGDQLVFYLMTNVSNHPLTICQNSTVPNFCSGAANNSQLNTPITMAGINTSATFTTAGIYYYGCLIHPGMGAIINVMQAVTNTTSTTMINTASVTVAPTTSRTNDGYKITGSFLLIAVTTIVAAMIL